METPADPPLADQPGQAPPTEIFSEVTVHSTPKKTAGGISPNPPSSLGEDSASYLSSPSRIAGSPARSVLRFGIMQTRVTLLDGAVYTCSIEKRVRGQVLLQKVCDHLNLMERDYFGLTYKDSDNQKALAQAILEARQQHPELSVTKVTVHKETEVSSEHPLP